MTNETTFQQSLKPNAVEEAVDYYFFRRLAHVLVPQLIRLGLSPNQVTFISLLWGLCGAWAAYQQYFLVSALLIIVAIVFDCCDGQVARLTGQTSPIGRAMDGTFDLIWVTSLWLGIFFSGYVQKSKLPGMSAFMYLGGAAMIIHCWAFDGIKVKYLELVEPDFSEKSVSTPIAWQMMKAYFRKGMLVHGVLAFCLAFQTYFFIDGGTQRKRFEPSARQREKIRAQLEPIMRFWTWLGEGQHNTLVIIGLLFAPLTPLVLYAAFFIISILMSLWMLVGLMRWTRLYGAIQKSLTHVAMSA